MPSITQVITSIAPAANPSTMTREVFSTTAAANVLGISAMTTELNTFATQVNTLTTSLNAIAAGTAIGIPYTFSTTTTDADPGAGYLRLDNATQNAATTIRADLSGNDASVWTAVLDTLDDSTSTLKGHVRLVKNGDATKWLIFTVSALASPSGYKNITVANVASSAASPFSNNDNIVFEFTRIGDKGDTGATGVGITAQSVGWTATGGTTPKTLTVVLDASVAGTNTGDQTAATVANTPDGNIAATTVQAAINELDTEKAALAGSASQAFTKVDPASPAFTKTGAGTLSIKAGTTVVVAGKEVIYAAATAVTMPSLTGGTDYAIWVKDDATIQATTDFASAPGAGNWRKIGNFHYAPGGNATASAGGDTTPAINEFSIFDLKFRPACPDPRGMAAVMNSFCADIYLTGVDHITNGTSKYNVTIADGSSPPKIPIVFGGTGSSAYTTYTRFEAANVLSSHGKRHPTYEEFGALAFGTTEATSGGTDPASTILRASFTSKHGIMLASGNMWIWGADFGGGAAAAGWVENTGGRGSTYQLENAALFGGSWSGTASGSLASNWSSPPTYSGDGSGSRGVCDLLILA